MQVIRCIGCLLVFVASTSAANAEEACELAPAKLRFEDDVACFRDAQPDNALDAVKFAPLTVDGGVRLSLGGEVRQRYEYTHNPAFGGDPQDENGAWLQRYTLHGDLHLGSHVRVFGQLLSALETGRAAGPSPVDENELALQNAFVDLRAPLGGDADVKLRLGRQELDFGSGRLVDVREGPNVRRTFDAVRAFVTAGDWRIDAVAARPRRTEPGVFDDRADRGQALWGIYAVGGDGVLPMGSVDFYYLGFRDEDAVFAQGGAEERRHSVGARLWGAQGGWDWNWEAVCQFGTFGEGEIDAWTVASVTGYTFERARWRPRVALSANIASGDGDPDDADLGTFNPLFPRGNYFSQAALLGPRNFFNFHGFLSVQPTERLTMTTDYNLFWRLDTEDGVYNSSGQIIVPGGGADRFVGSAMSITAEYDLTPMEIDRMASVFDDEDLRSSFAMKRKQVGG